MFSKAFFFSRGVKCRDSVIKVQVIQLDTLKTLKDTFQLRAALNCVSEVINEKLHVQKVHKCVYFLNGNISGK